MTYIQTRLYPDPAALQADFSPRVAGADVVVLFALGFAPADFLPFAAGVPVRTTLLLADCYGILGWSAAENRNLEFMEAGCGREYGGVGGDGGCGVVAVAFTGAVTSGADSLSAANSAAHLVIATSGSDVNSVLDRQAQAVYYGGLAKTCHRYRPERRQFESTPFFCITFSKGSGQTVVGTTSFTRDAAGAVQTLLAQAPAGMTTQAVGLFPCFMRGKNEYGRNNVESDIIAGLLPQAPIYGMFCHGELGPRWCLGFDADEWPQQACTLHSMTTIVAVHGVRPS
jgi:hypothetical protein